MSLSKILSCVIVFFLNVIAFFINSSHHIVFWYRFDLASIFKYIYIFIQNSFGLFFFIIRIVPLSLSLRQSLFFSGFVLFRFVLFFLFHLVFFLHIHRYIISNFSRVFWTITQITFLFTILKVYSYISYFQTIKL